MKTAASAMVVNVYKQSFWHRCYTHLLLWLRAAAHTHFNTFLPWKPLNDTWESKNSISFPLFRCRTRGEREQLAITYWRTFVAWCSRTHLPVPAAGGMPESVANFHRKTIERRGKLVQRANGRWDQMFVLQFTVWSGLVTRRRNELSEIPSLLPHTRWCGFQSKLQTFQSTIQARLYVSCTYIERTTR